MTLFFIGLAMLLAAAVGAEVIRDETLRSRVFATLVVAGALIAAVPVVGVLAGGQALSARWPSSVPGGDWVIGIDALSAVFLLAVLGVGAVGGAYGTAYMRAAGNERRARRSHAIYALLVVSLALVVTAQCVVLFLGAWELMAIGSFLLIITDHEHAEVRRAGLLFIVLTHAGTLLLFVMFAVWARGTGDWSFASLASVSPGPGGGVAAVLLLALVGFGVKAGCVPLHFWLPPAHAAAPSHVSALMSGIVIKTGIYGLLRVVMLIGPTPVWWGWTVLVLGVASAVLGVLWALAQHDIKRLLAYHSVENIGIIFIGIGLGALGAAYGHPALAILGYGAAVLHTVNHALFKALLFLSAGVVYRMTGTRNMEELGGLARSMPVTWLAFLIGSIAIVGLPPLNGFVSEWLVYQVLFRAGTMAGGMKMALLGAPALALVGGLALACFAKAAGVIFLGRARSRRPLSAREGTAGFIVPAVVLTAACVILGLLPSLVVPPFLRVGAAVAGGQFVASEAVISNVIGDAQTVTMYAAALIVLGVLFWVGRSAVLRRRIVRTDETWGCGYPAPTPRMQYTASSFAAPLLAVFGGLTGVREHRGATVYHSAPLDLVLDGTAIPLWMHLQRAALRLRPMQQGRLHIYLLYIVAALLALLVYLVAAPQG